MTVSLPLAVVIASALGGGLPIPVPNAVAETAVYLPLVVGAQAVLIYFGDWYLSVRHSALLSLLFGASSRY